MDPTSTDPRATCAIHPDAAALAVCARCGNFMCSECSVGGTSDACPPCRALAGDIPGFTARRDRFALAEIFEISANAFSKQWLMLSAVAFIYLLILFAVGLATQVVYAVGMAVHPAVGIASSLVTSFVQAVAQAVLTGGLVVVLFDVMRGGTVDVARLFGQFSNLRAYVTMTLVMFGAFLGLALALVVVFGIPGYYLFGDAEESTLLPVIGAAALAALVPTLWLALPFMFPEMEIALGAAPGGWEAVQRSFALAKSKRLWMLLIYVIGLVFMAVGLIALCIGFIPMFALAALLKLALFYALRAGSGLPQLHPPPP